jgi:hypothetical protein
VADDAGATAVRADARVEVEVAAGVADLETGEPLGPGARFGSPA